MLILDSFSLEQYLVATLDYIKPYAVVEQGDVFGMAQLLWIALHQQQEEENSITHTAYSYIPSLLTGTCKVWMVAPGFWKQNTIGTNIGTKLRTKIGAI